MAQSSFEAAREAAREDGIYRAKDGEAANVLHAAKFRQRFLFSHKSTKRLVCGACVYASASQ